MANNFLIFESELLAIAYEANKKINCETGGDLYGLWTANGNPVIYLATGPGEKAIGQAYEYEMDVGYMKECERFLRENYGIHYLGDWHSHHSLSLNQPSSGDQRRIQNLLRKNNIYSMAEIIVTHNYNESLLRERIDAYTYKKKYLEQREIRTLGSKKSPIRILLQSDPTTKLFNLGNEQFPIDQILINCRNYASCSKLSKSDETPPDFKLKSIKIKF